MCIPFKSNDLDSVCGEPKTIGLKPNFHMYHCATFCFVLNRIFRLCNHQENMSVQ